MKHAQNSETLFPLYFRGPQPLKNILQARQNNMSQYVIVVWLIKIVVQYARVYCSTISNIQAQFPCMQKTSRRLGETKLPGHDLIGRGARNDEILFLMDPLILF